MYAQPLTGLRRDHRSMHCKPTSGLSGWTLANRFLRYQWDVETKGYIVALPDRHYPPFHPGDISGSFLVGGAISIDGIVSTV